MNELLFLLLPIAFYSGWRASGKTSKRKAPEKRPLSDNFVKGVNYLLSEEPDKALDVFLNRPEIDEYTAETYLLLGNLFRNRGEVDRALSVHQNLIGRATLSREQKTVTMLALGKDFLAAGMLDRAERVFNELLQSDSDDIEAHEALRAIYEQTQEWVKAIQVTEEVQRLKTEDVSNLIANYYCELAEQELDKGHLHRCAEYLVQAGEACPESTRTQVLLASMDVLQQEYPQACERYLDVAHKAPRLLGMIFEPMVDAYQKAGIIAQLQDQLFAVYEECKDVKVLEFTLRLAIEHGVSDKVKDQLPDVLSQKQLNVRTISKAVSLFREQKPVEAPVALELLDKSMGNYLSTQPGFQCRFCGYKMHDFLWRCPACNQWDEVAHV